MKKTLALLFIGLLLGGMVPLPAGAETFYGDDSWNVTFNGSKMVSSFHSSDIDDVILQIEPGDAAIIHVTLKNTSRKDTHWYMTNEILRSLEDSQTVAEGGAYGYTLTYAGPSGEMRAFFDSDAVGGEGITGTGEGLHQIPDALNDYFYVGKLSPNQSGTITLGVRLDGETQGNAYQDTLAKLQMQFAVEENTSISTIPQTGDPSRILLFAWVMLVSGLCLLGIAISRWRKKGETA